MVGQGNGSPTTIQGEQDTPTSGSSKTGDGLGGSGGQLPIEFPDEENFVSGGFSFGHMTDTEQRARAHVFEKSSDHSLYWTQADEVSKVTAVTWVYRAHDSARGKRDGEGGDFEILINATSTQGGSPQPGFNVNPEAKSVTFNWDMLGARYQSRLGDEMALAVNYIKSSNGRSEWSVARSPSFSFSSDPDSVVRDMVGWLGDDSAESGCDGDSCNLPSPTEVSGDISASGTAAIESKTPASGPVDSPDDGEGASGGDTKGNHAGGGGGGGGGLSTGAIAGIAVGAAVVGLVLLGGLIWFFLRRHKRNKATAPYDKHQASGTYIVEQKDQDVAGSPYLDHHHGQTMPLAGMGHQHEDDSYSSPYDQPHGSTGAHVPDATTAAAASPTSRSAVEDDTRSAPHSSQQQPASNSYAHLVEEGMTPDEIRRLEEEERHLDDEIERAGRR